MFNTSSSSGPQPGIRLLTFNVGIITSFKISWSIPTHSSIKPAWKRLPLVFSVAATFSSVEPFLKVYMTLSLVCEVRALVPRVSHIISFSKAGINLQISPTLLDRICADCSLPPATVNNCEPGYKIALIIKHITDIKDFDHARTNVAKTYLCRITTLKNNL